MPPTLAVTEIFHSIQGEGTRAGQRCVFVRLMGCHLRCHYCDTEYAFHEGQRQPIDAVLAKVAGYGCDLVEVTGGEPLLQPNVHDLMARLCDAGYTVLLETSGASDISGCDLRIVRIMDLKTPGSGEAKRNYWPNIGHLTPRDEIKFVICDRQDYEWARDRIQEHDLSDRVAAILFSPVSLVNPGKEVAGAPALPPQELAQWLLDDRLPNVRFQSQLHKLIWDPLARGV